ncbi:MAG: glycosyltransferase [Actinobacteria bacterium 13_2_20CM_2_71_6]|nr:MAG: glycosyltransferase [Actinobacteria bacterium 13_2_20CM_2_71_6]
MDVELAGVSFHALTEDEAVARVREALARGEGGRILTPNVDILRQRPAAYAADASLVVADGMPLVWASRLAGTPLPERVAGASLVWSLSRAMAADGRSVFLLGGEPPVGAARAAAALLAAYPHLRVSGVSPAYGFESTNFPGVREAVRAAAPDLVFVGLGFPRQEEVISRLRPDLPDAWFLGCGMAINFVAGDHRRAPGWMQRNGLEWLYRLGSEPRRLAGRYLRHDAPYAARLLANAAAARYGDRARPSV